MDLFDYINPLQHFGKEQYLDFWQALFATLLQGFWSRVFALSFLVLAFWFGVRRQRLQVGATFFLLSILTAYGATILKGVGLIR